ncbi:iron ABC transporter permease [Salinibacterium sp. SYSU T00001]|uniref:FecCD family ABC transporter permease n=1 Tax=Homoserinimonas sedimenticola TaxID=2986805 RepID=UPI0022361366|nr:iron ABC transporter permease [Salinibacterium sedimenticola]MCW4384893.1 iron ABC transporter permease [Salinibacterium sedimenticola]
MTVATAGAKATEPGAVTDAAPAPRADGRRRRIRAWGLAASVVLLVVAVVLSLALGTRAIPLPDVLAALFTTAPGDPLQVIVRDLRVPRTLIGIAVGLALGLAGTLMQGVTRNPLADPGILGVNAGASLLVVIAIAVFGVTAPLGFIWFAFAGAAAAAALVYGIGALGRDGATPVKLAIAGTAITAAATSVVTLLLITDIETLSAYRFWQVGSLAGRGVDILTVLWPFIAVGALLALLLTRDLNLLAFGDDVARGLGHNAALTRALAGVSVVLLCGTATAIAGPIVFVGLVIPHIARAITGPDYRWIFAFSLVLGPVLVLLADVLGRLVVAPSELEVGLVVAAVGAPVMIALVRRVRLGSL